MNNIIKTIILSLPAIAFILISYFWTFTGFKDSYYLVKVYDNETKVEMECEVNTKEQCYELRTCSRFDKLELRENELICSESGNVTYSSEEFIAGWGWVESIFTSILFLIIMGFVYLNIFLFIKYI